MGEDKENVLPELGEETTSSAEGQAASSAVDIRGLEASLKSYIDQAVERMWQSGKDKRIAQLTGKVSDFERELAEYRALIDRGLSHEDALWRMKVERAIAGSSETEAAAVREEKQETAAPSVPSADVQSILDVLGIDANDPEVSEVLRRGGNVQQGLIDLAIKRRARQKAAAAAQVLPTASGESVNTQEEIDALTARLAELNRHPSQHMREIREISERLARLLPRR
jgi:hypothetical protein